MARTIGTSRALRACQLALLALAVAATSGAARAQEAGFVVIVNSSNPVSSMSRTDVARRFLKQTTTWPNGARVEPVDQSKSSPVRAAFSRQVLGRSMASVESYWLQAVFSGREVPPPERSSDADVVAFVRSVPNAIGYVSAVAPMEGVKKLTVER